LHIINGEHYAGAERVQDLLSGILPGMGFDITLAAIKPGRFAAARQATSARLVEVSMRNRLNLGVVDRLIDLVKTEGMELLHAHSPRTALVTRLVSQRTKVPWVYHVHSPVSRDSTRWLQNWLNSRVERWAVRQAARLICVSPSLEQYMHRCGVPGDIITCIPNGVPISPAARDRLAPSGTWTLGIVALFRPRKGLEVLLEALAVFHSRGANVRLLAVGDFESAAYESAIMCQAERLQLGDIIEWRGFSNDVARELDRIHLLVLPSLFGEGLPMVVLEAMAAGVPVVASRVEGVPEAVIHQQTGLLVEASRVDQLVQAIEQFITCRVDYADMSCRARARHRERFSDVAMAADVAAVYHDVLVARTGR
jgi:glycosyltransferase involved in cell wall biosynthesis